MLMAAGIPAGSYQPGVTSKIELYGPSWPYIIRSWRRDSVARLLRFLRACHERAIGKEPIVCGRQWRIWLFGKPSETRSDEVGQQS